MWSITQNGAIIGYIGNLKHIGQMNDMTDSIITTPSSAPCLLRILMGIQVALALTTVFTQIRKHHCFGRHIEPHRKGLSGKQYFHISLSKHDLHHFAEHRNQASMMDSNPLLEQLHHHAVFGQIHILMSIIKFSQNMSAFGFYFLKLLLLQKTYCQFFSVCFHQSARIYKANSW